MSSADLGVLAASESLAGFLQDLDAAGIATDPALRLETTNGVVSYYDRSRAVISIATPGDSGRAAGLQRLAARSMLGLRDDRTLEELFRFAIPFTVAHELGHHLRHFHGRFGGDIWHEEQVANMFASALQKRRYSPAERSDAVQLIAGVLEHLGSKGGSNDAVVDSYGSLLAALDAAGLISEATLAGIALIEKYIPDDSTTGELPSGRASPAPRRRHRESVVEEFGQMYTSDVLRYVSSPARLAGDRDVEPRVTASGHAGTDTSEGSAAGSSAPGRGGGQGTRTSSWSRGEARAHVLGQPEPPILSFATGTRCSRCCSKATTRTSGKRGQQHAPT